MIHGEEVDNVLAAAIRQRLALTVTIEHQNQWMSFRSRIVTLVEGLLLFEVPSTGPGLEVGEVLLGRTCMLSFRFQSFRYFFNALLGEGGKWPLQDGSEIPVLSVALPRRLDRLERRAFERIDVPSRQMVRATVWSCPSRRPAWSGKVTNLSAGGLQMRTSRTATDFFEPGDNLNVLIWFASDDEPVPVEAYYRHGTCDGEMALLGLEFASFYSTPEGRQVYETLLAKIDEYRPAAKAKLRDPSRT